MVEYLAKRTGHRFVRINNHEHTDLQNTSVPTFPIRKVGSCSRKEFSSKQFARYFNR
jgi:midasin (ATPase involved in ribosome maturation)